PLDREESAGRFTLPERLIGGDFAAKNKVAQHLVAAGRPVPFLELEAEPVELLGEKSWGIHRRSQEPPLARVEVECGSLVAAAKTDRVRPGREPAEVRGVKDQ